MSKIAELKAGDGNVDIEATVVSVAEPRTYEKFGREGRVAKAVIKDDSGEITLTLWNDQVDQIKDGKKMYSYKHHQTLLVIIMYLMKI